MSYVYHGDAKKRNNYGHDMVEQELFKEYKKLGEEKFDKKIDEVMKRVAKKFNLFLTQNYFTEEYQFCEEDPGNGFFG